MEEFYTSAFYDDNRTFAEESSFVIARIVMGLFHPSSVVDIGCSTGQWLKAFADVGVTRYHGFDGNWVPLEKLLIPKSCFTTIDLSKQMPSANGFDLATCLEVAEHLPLESSVALVECLTRLAPIVVFSAAIPGQPGTNHINTQWPWFWRELFRERKFTCVDAIRPSILYDPRVAWFYRQNITCFVSDNALPKYSALTTYLRYSEAKWVLVPIAERILKARVEKLEAYAAKVLLRALLRKAARRMGFRRRES